MFCFVLGGGGSESVAIHLHVSIGPLPCEDSTLWCCKLFSCLKFARLTSVLVSFDGCDDECAPGFVLDSVSPRFTANEHLRVHWNCVYS